MMPNPRLLYSTLFLLLLAMTIAITRSAIGQAPTQPAPEKLVERFDRGVHPLLTRFCNDCHSAKRMKGDLDLERFADTAAVGRDLETWRRVIEMIEDGEMPPRREPQPTQDEAASIVAWAKAFIDAEVRARAGDPGRVVLRRLNNVEYNRTVRDLTGVDLNPARQFPVDGAAGEGFTNTGQSLVMSPGMLTKYLDAGREIASHAVLTPDGLRFSDATTRRDWTDESLDDIRAFYRRFSTDGRLNVRPYIDATLRHREALSDGKVTTAQLAAQLGLNAPYLTTLWQALRDDGAPAPFGAIAASWRAAGPGDADTVVRLIDEFRAVGWKYNVVGSYMADMWQAPVTPPLERTATLRFRPKVEPNATDATIYLTARSLGGDAARLGWRRPRIEGGGEPVLLSELSQTYRRMAAANGERLKKTDRYLAAAASTVGPNALSVADAATRFDVDGDALDRWVRFLGLMHDGPGRFTPDSRKPPELALLKRRLVHGDPVTGWGQNEQSELPVVVSNMSDEVRQVPGTVEPHRVVVHPMPRQFVAVAWRSPVAGPVRVAATITKRHDACGNGVTWWLEHRRGDRAQRLVGGRLDRVGADSLDPRTIQVEADDLVMIVVAARDFEHTCDLTQVDFAINELLEGGRKWDLAADVADSIGAGNPHPDSYDHPDVWRFVMGPDDGSAAEEPRGRRVAAGSTLSRWCEAATRPDRVDEVDALARQVHEQLTGPRPDQAGPDRDVHDMLRGPESPLVDGEVGDAEAASPYGLPAQRFEATDVVANSNDVIAVRLPAEAIRGREFVVDVEMVSDAPVGMARVALRDSPLDARAPLGGDAPIVSNVDADTASAGFERFHELFPNHLYKPDIVPVDEIISLRLFCREDDHLKRLFLSDMERDEVDRLWRDLEFISQQHLTEFRNYSVFMGFVSQGGDAEFKKVDGRLREPVAARAKAFEQQLAEAEPKHLDAVIDFAALAYRRPLTDVEVEELRSLYRSLRDQELDHEAAIRLVIARVLVSPPFIYRLETPPAGVDAAPVSDRELATRLSYFLWSSMPDEALRVAANTGRLNDEAVLIEQTRRMLADDRARALATEFAGQWLHFRDFADHNEKSETLFPMFNEGLRASMLEESVLFFEDLFRRDGSVLAILDADYTFVDPRLATHYGIPGVEGEGFRRVENVRRFGRGGVLGLATILTRQSGASRTSPVLRGTWLSETLLGEKLPKPPPNVPQLADNDGATAELTTRQLTERHRADPDCAKCHDRIDPFGFALEAYDPIGRLRERDAGGHLVDTRAELVNGTKFVGIDGLREYLLKQRRDDFLRVFSRKLVGYALGRSVTVSDEPLIEEMIESGEANDHRFSAYVETLVKSRQFRYVRGRDYVEP